VWRLAARGIKVPRILVADDNTNIQKMVVLAFQERGVEVIAVGNGEAAVRRLPDANPDLVLADVFMPVRNGYEVCEFVKKDPRFAHVPVILLVGAFDPLDEKEARRVGADGVLKKPFVPPDPLIAMVMSALEKNPKVAAELAKAKEVAAEALLPPALPEVPLKAEPKPLPEFPEPTAEEAAVIYGFGKGVRAIDLDDAAEEDEEQSSKSKKLAKPVKDAKAPKTPAAPKTPVVAAMDDDEDDFDSSVTANDWRRNAADFEVPENVAADPVYSYGKGFEPITFPSEKDVPPRRRKTDEVSVEETAASADSKVAAKFDAPAVQSPAAETSPAPAHASSDRAPAKKSNDWDVKDQPEIELAAGSFSRVEEPDSQARFAQAGTGKIETAKAAAEPSAAEQPPAALEPPPSRPTLVSRMRGWMDMLTPSSPDHSASSEAEPAQSADNHWMSNLSSPASAAASSSAASAPAAESHAAPAAESSAAPVEAAASAAPVVDHAAETQPLDATPFVSAAAEPPPAATEFFAPTTNSEVSHDAREEARDAGGAEVREDAGAAPGAATHDESHDEPHAGSHAGEAQPRQFGDGGASDAKFGGSSYHFSDDPHHGSQREVHDDGLELDQAPVQDAASDYSSGATVSEGLNGEAEPQPEPASSSAADFSPTISPESSPEISQELMPSPADVRGNGSGALSGMLPAEPLFGSEQREEIADDYSPLDQEPSQADTRQQEAYAEDTHPGQLPQPAPSEEYWDREAAAREAEALAQSGASLFSESAPEPPAMQGFERIPTLPPPNREALSEIPFLMPPVLPPQNSEQPAARSNDSEAVDDMVRKVMEKLGPHLQELLSQGVKPLVENLLQNELQKKDR
jgi:CheY-like chemotaxis protein